jgi:hypothetical protein
MTSYTLTTAAADLGGPALVSELPPATPARPSLLSRVRDELTARRAARELDRALRSVAHNEQGDLLALARRS